MTLSIREKLKLQQRAKLLSLEIATNIALRDKLTLQKEKASIISKLKGEAKLSEEAKSIDAKANEAATSPRNNLPEPTDAQKEAGNYKKGHITIEGMDIVIENPRGSTRRSKASDPNKWETKMHHHYGDFKGTVGADDDPVDVFVNDEQNFELVFVIDQINPVKRVFDEHKVMLGFSSSTDAKKAYLKNYDSRWQGLGAITAMSLEKFKQWLYSGKKTSPIKYSNGQLPVTFEEQSNPIKLTNLSYDKYLDLNRNKIKQITLQLAEDGYSLSVLRELLTLWLEKNESALVDY